MKNAEFFAGALTLAEAERALAIPGAARPLNPTPIDRPEPGRETFTPIEPAELFDGVYFVGTAAVGSIVIDSGDGLVMIDAGCAAHDAAIMADGMKKLGLDPGLVKLILVSHEHFDHYGGINYFLESYCPDAKVAMSLVGWNLLQAAPMEWAFRGPRAKKCDIFLTDGMVLRLGGFTVRCVYTPGHSAGCMSFIFPVTLGGEPHMAGMMGGSGVWPVPTEANLYMSSVDYFAAFAKAAGCDAGIAVHSRDELISSVRNLKKGEAHPMLYPGDSYDRVFLQVFRDKAAAMLASAAMMPYPQPPRPPVKN